MNSEVQRKHPHVAGPTVYFAGRFDQSLNAPGIPNGTRSASTRISSMIAVSIDAGRILHKLSLLEKKNLESEIEFLPRPCRWCFQGWFTGSGANRQNRLRSSPALTHFGRDGRPGYSALHDSVRSGRTAPDHAPLYRFHQ